MIFVVGFLRLVLERDGRVGSAHDGEEITVKRQVIFLPNSALAEAEEC